MRISRILEFIANNPGVPGAANWIGRLRADGLTGDRLWALPNKSGTLVLDVDTPMIPWTSRYELAAGGILPGLIPWKPVPTEANYCQGWLIGGGGGSGSGARGATTANRTGGSSGSAGGRTYFYLSLANIAAKLNCSLSQLQFREQIGSAGNSGAAVSTDNTDGANGSSGATTTLQFRPDPATGNPAPPVTVSRAPGGVGGLGGRRGGVATTGGAAIALGATFPGQVGQAGRFVGGNGGGPHNGGAAAGGGGSGSPAGAGVGTSGVASGPGCYDQFGDLAGITAPGTYPNPGNAAIVLISGMGGSGGASGGYAPGLAGQPGGSGFRGGSGGGGGASDNGFASGAGGPSGHGYSIVTFSPLP